MDYLELIQSYKRANLYQILYWTKIGLKAQNQKMQRQILKKNIYPKLVKSIIKFYNFKHYQLLHIDKFILQLE